jgi:hypothetical protein
MTMNETTGYLDQLIRATDKSEAELMALVFRVGLRQVWREHVLGRYLRGDLSRDDAVEAVGLDWVELAERQHEAAMEDIAWALQE